MTQSRRHSLYEAIFNTILGMLVSFLISFLVYPALGMSASATDYAVATAIFTVVSVVRNYVVRRVGNWWSHR